MIRKLRKNYNTLKWVVGLLLFIFLLLTVSAGYFGAKLKPIVKTQIKELVLDATDSLYRIEFSEISMNLITGGASLNDVKIIPDTNVFKRLILKRKAPNNVYYITLKKLGIKNFHPIRLLKQK